MNCGLKARHPCSAHRGGLDRPTPASPVRWTRAASFDYKWDLGWMHDTLNSARRGSPTSGCADRGKLLWSMHYFANERYLLLRTTKVVHGKASISRNGADERSGDAAGRRTMPFICRGILGKKPISWAMSWGQLYEWNEAGTLDGALRSARLHLFFHSLCKNLSG